MKSNLYKYIIFLVIGVVLGCVAVVGIFHARFFASTGSDIFSGYSITPDARLNTGNYKFIKPLLNSGYGNEEETLKWFPSERKLKNSVQDVVGQNQDLKVGIFFLNLTNSGWFGINSSDNFIPASLLKLPMLISYYKLHETEKDLFDQKITYQGQNFDTAQTLGTGTITSGQTYTVKELIQEMIINSDNNALELLYKYRQDSLKSIFADMQIPLPATDSEISQKDFMTTRDIARFLLVLYNASYLSKNDSEEALQILSKTNFQDGIVAGVPSNVVISHKFGERELTQDNKTLEELHDCGIVYHPKTPYIICIMTKGGDINSEKLQIQKISKIIYDGVNAFSNGAQ